MRKPDSQTSRILEHLKQHKDGITPAQAVTLFNCYRLSGRIKDLRNDGYKIETIREPNWYNENTHARYVLRGDAK